MRNPVPDRDGVATQDPRSKALIVTKAWKEFFAAIVDALFGWRKTYTAVKTFDFGNINAGAQATTTVSVPGAQVGDAVLARPTTAVNGIIIDGTVSAKDTVEIRAVNYSAAPIDPASQDYRVIVWQQ